MKKQLKYSTIKLIILVFTLFLHTTNGGAQQNNNIDTLSNSSQISILTSSPSDEQVYAVFGHSAMRVYDPVLELDYVFNYGIFDFNSPNFIWRFAKGETDYIVLPIDYDIYLNQYEGRDVYEQVINLTYTEKQLIWDFLLNNIKPENRIYRYNVFFNNCTTKLTDILELNINGRIIYPAFNDKTTFRELLGECTYKQPWLAFGINLVFGGGVDKTVTLKEKMFLPLNQMKTFDKCEIERADGGSIPLVLKSEKLLTSDISENNIAKKGFLNTPLFVGFCLLFISILISFYEYKKRKMMVGKLFDFFLFLVTGSMGLILLFLMFSSHPLTRFNWNIIWLNPLALILSILILIKSCAKYVFYFQLINSVILTLFICSLLFLPQKLDLVFIPFILVAWLRTIMRVLVKD